MVNYEKAQKTLIGVLASHDSPEKNNNLARLFENLYKDHLKRLDCFHFLFTGGTFKRIVLGDKSTLTRNVQDIYAPIDDKNLQDYLKENSTVLPDNKNGGVTILANFIVQRQLSILWPFLSPIEMCWLNPRNLALTRLCDVWNVKRLMNSGSVLNWVRDEAERDANRNKQKIPIDIRFGDRKYDPGTRNLVGSEWYVQWRTGATESLEAQENFDMNENSKYPLYYFESPLPKKREKGFWHLFNNQTIALIAHDEMKSKMIDFAIEYERELSAFKRILATGTTGKEVEDACKNLKVQRCKSGPKGGDIEIATEILYGRCDVVIFFVDPMHAHPHIEDIRVVFAACMIENEVRMLTNEVQAREWMDLSVRPNINT
ncbi:MAG: methylglyoxal synthase [Acidobacteriota bacterium]|nr:methylglyoxal synthase [Acidobacteriota bacterium]